MSDDMFYCSFVSIHYIICECGDTFPSEEDLKTHLEKEHALKKERKEYICGICEALFNTEESCMEHYESSHLDVKVEESENEEITEAPDMVEEENKIIIEEIFAPDADSVPIKPVQKQRKKGRKPSSYYNIKNIVCEVCGKRYASNAALKYHQRVHTGERPYKCNECSKTFTMPLFLQIHVRTHTGERPYECSLCPKAFSNKAALLRHDRVHTGIKPYECPKCGKFFTQSNSMKLHVNTVHLKMPAPYKSKTRRMKAQERQLLKNSILAKAGSSAAVETITSEANLSETDLSMQYIKPEVSDIYQEVEEGDIMYEDVDSREITYEVVYEE